MNVAELHEAVRTASVRNETAEVALVQAVADEQVVRALWILAIGLILDPAELDVVVSETWEQADGGARDVLQEASRWPFVVRERRGWRLDDAVAQGFMLNFRAVDPGAFERAHAVLAAREERRELAHDPDDTWFVKGRLAFYLAGFDQQRSVTLFEDAFASPPTLDRRTTRIWLTSLVLRQEPLLGNYSRDVAFYRGFRAYVLGRRRDALKDFESVVAKPCGDRLEAIAKHLLGVIMRADDYSRSNKLLRESVALSEALELVDNQVMAGNTLAWNCIRQAHERNTAGDREPKQALAEARRLSERNFELARLTNEPGLLRWTQYARASIRWLAATDLRRHPERPSKAEAEAILAELAMARDGALSAGDTETAGLAANEIAGVLRDTGNVEAALDAIELFFTALPGGIPESIAKHLKKTAGSVMRTSAPEVRARAASMIDSIDRLPRRAAEDMGVLF